MLNVQVRELLDVPPEIRALPVRERKSRKKRFPEFPEDEFARRRWEELQRTGVQARLRRYRKNEPLCVVYQLT